MRAHKFANDYADARFGACSAFEPPTHLGFVLEAFAQIGDITWAEPTVNPAGFQHLFVRGPNGGIFVSFEMNATAYQLIDKLLNKYTMSPALNMDYVAQVQLLKVIDTLSDPNALLKLIDRDTDTIGDFIKRYEAFNEANPEHAKRVKELMEEMKQSKIKKAA